MNKITVSVSSEYDVLVGAGLLKQAGELVAAVKKPCRAAIVCDENVFPLYADILAKALKTAGFVTDIFTIKPGEGSKSIGVFAQLLEFLAERSYTRSDILLALGGGVTGDLTGFAASAYLRGIDFVQVPTTFLAAVDSSVGGKTGINLQAGKNLAGAFCQPRLVLCDTDTLKTLPPEIMGDGIAEAIKYGVIRDSGLFDILAGGANWEAESVISACVAIKRHMVMEDERDIGLRQHLNFGHTIGHAIEKCSDYSISHGRAVAIGMHMVTKSAEKAGLCPAGISGKIKLALEKYSLPGQCGFSAGQLAKAALKDKKRQGDTITLILPQKIGSSILHKMPVAELESFIKIGLEDA